MTDKTKLQKTKTIIEIFSLLFLLGVIVFTFVYIPETAYFAGEYRFYFTSALDGRYLGLTLQSNSQVILLDDDLKNTEESLRIVCNHEMCHNQIRLANDLEERICSEFDGYLRYPECESLINITNNEKEAK